jgi:hypothetical protein
MGFAVVDCTPYDQKFQSVSGSLGFRCKVANSSGSVFHLCIHFNKCTGGHGVEAYATSATGRQYAQQLCDAVAALGFTNRGVKDGSDLFVVKYTNMACVLLEVCFVDSLDDMNRYNEDAVAAAIVKALTGQTPSLISYKSHVQSIGWQDFVTDGQTSGTEGKALSIEALVINSGVPLSIEAHVQDIGWMAPKHNGEIVGTTGQSKRMEAIKIKSLDPVYDVQYQTHVQDIGWQDWKHNGDVSGTVGQAKRIEAIRIKIVKK